MNLASNAYYTIPSLEYDYLSIRWQPRRGDDVRFRFDEHCM